MGGAMSDEQWFDAMEACEDELLRLSDIPTEEIKKSFTTIQMEGKPFNVRTFTIGEESEDKMTMVLLSGYMTRVLSFYKMLIPLREHYKIIMFDPASWGSNTRLTESKGLESPEAAEDWLIDWIVKVMDALNLPDKFHCVGWSMGGWMLS